MNRPKSQEEDTIGQTQLMALRCPVLMTAMPTIATSMASAREIRYKVPTKFIVKVGQRPRADTDTDTFWLWDPGHPLTS